MKLLLTFALFGSAVLVLFASDLGGRKPKIRAVPDKATAVRIAIAAWAPLYGERKIASEAPYSATLANGVWFVDGSLSTASGVLAIGGAAHAEIAEADGRVLSVVHFQ